MCSSCLQISVHVEYPLPARELVRPYPLQVSSPQSCVGRFVAVNSSCLKYFDIMLCGLLCREVGDKKVIVFANTKANCELVSQTLYAKGYSCTVLHSGKSQVQDIILLRY